MKLIAETALHHQGDFQFQKSLVSDIIQYTGASVIKLHLTLNLTEYMAEDHPLIAELRKLVFNESEWHEIIGMITQSTKELMLLFNDTRAVEFGMKYDPAYVEIHSVCLNDVNLLDALKQHLRPETTVVLGVGGSSIYEVENAINILRHPKILLMFGFQNYPTKYEDISFDKTRRIMKLFPECEFGYADHTAWNEPNNVLITMLGAALGVTCIEKHVTNSYGKERVDWSAAVSIEMFNEIRNKMDLLDACNGSGLLCLNQSEKDYSVCGPMKKAAMSTRDLKAGQRLERNMIIFKRTGQTSDLSQLEAIDNIGKEILRDIKMGQVLMQNHFSDKRKM